MSGNITIRLRPVVPSLRVKLAIAPSTPTLDAAVTAAQAAQAGAEQAETNSQANAALTAADVVLSHADVVLTHADVVLTHADASATAADVISTGADAAATAADVVTTGNNAASTAADVVTANNAANSASASASDAEDIFLDFDKRYLGDLPSDPTLDNQGNALETGAAYFNSSSDTLKIRNSSAAWQSYSAASGLTAVVDDTAPTLGGNLDTNGFTVAGRNVATDGTKLDGIEASADVTDAANIASSIHGVSGKTTPVDADELGLIDSAASNTLKKVTWANVKATLKTATDALYQALQANLTAIAGLSTAADKVSYWTGSGTAALTDLPSYGRTVISQTSEANLKAAINAEAGVDFMAYDAQLSSVMTPVSKATGNLVLTDLGKLLTPSTSGQTVTIQPNSTVNLPLGFVCAFFGNANSITIAKGSGVTLIWSPSAANANRTLASAGYCTVHQYATDFWVISGTGLS